MVIAITSIAIGLLLILPFIVVYILSKRNGLS